MTPSSPYDSRQVYRLKNREDTGLSNEREVETLPHELRGRVCDGLASLPASAWPRRKMLAEVANFIAKKRPENCDVCDLRSRQVRAELLSTVPVDEVGGYRRGVLRSSPRPASQRLLPSRPSRYS
jgi:hypothetical protein